MWALNQLWPFVCAFCAETKSSPERLGFRAQHPSLAQVNWHTSWDIGVCNWVARTGYISGYSCCECRLLLKCLLKYLPICLLEHNHGQTISVTVLWSFWSVTIWMFCVLWSHVFWNVVVFWPSGPPCTDVPENTAQTRGWAHDCSKSFWHQTCFITQTHRLLILKLCKYNAWQHWLLSVCADCSTNNKF